MKIALALFVVSAATIGITSAWAEEKAKRNPAGSFSNKFEWKTKSVTGGEVVCGVTTADGYDASTPGLSYSAASSTSCVFVPAK